MQVKELLLKAADHINEVGLHKGNFFEDYDRMNTGPCCTRGAFEVAAGYRQAEDYGVIQAALQRIDGARRALAAHLGLELNERDEPVAAWNDAPERTKEEVVAALRACAAAQLEDQ